jgi:hypothetical protein
MRKILKMRWTRAGVLGLAALLFCGSARAGQSVTLAWDPSLDPVVAGYAVYYGDHGAASGDSASRADAGANTSVTISGLREGHTYYFAAVAYDILGEESAPSPEVTYIVPGLLVLSPGTDSGKTMNLNFPVAPGGWYELQVTADLHSWTNLWQIGTSTSNAWVQFADTQANPAPQRFYRLILH